MKDARFLAYSLALAMALIVVGATYGAVLMLRSFNFQDIFTIVKLSDPMKVFISLYLTAAVVGVGFAGTALFMISKRRVRSGGWLGVLAAASTIAAVLVGPAYGVIIDPSSVAIISIGAALCSRRDTRT